MSIEKFGPNLENLSNTNEIRKKRYEHIVEKAKKSEYWNRPVPDNEEWGTIGDLFENILEYGGPEKAGSPEDLNKFQRAEKIANKLIELGLFDSHAFAYGEKHAKGEALAEAESRIEDVERLKRKYADNPDVDIDMIEESIVKNPLNPEKFIEERSGR